MSKQPQIFLHTTGFIICSGILNQSRMNSQIHANWRILSNNHCITCKPRTDWHKELKTSSYCSTYNIHLKLRKVLSFFMIFITVTAVSKLNPEAPVTGRRRTVATSIDNRAAIWNPRENYTESHWTPVRGSLRRDINIITELQGLALAVMSAKIARELRERRRITGGHLRS